ncbi:MAG: bifunctional (p)ppGpp synthetase/guanosine-3',5'-bis(diphosphate) 3'-pyrophosphohydrolase, partial [Candidatus Eisenbacteria bacterium]|nr:bifunctional (p)ppGpp synthetase/guanosine-3',5'-bis(diphosphate) 3'-pyrophosphohydrolase [Candidatus Eisenbacteria bacterium]
MNQTPEQTERLLTSFMEKVRKRCPRVNLALVEKALRYSAAAHSGQLRKSGEPFITHCVEVASIEIDLLERRMDTLLLCSSLLHDVMEDVGVSAEELSREFGPEVANLVNGVTKISGIRFISKEVEQAEYFRKMILSLAADVRVVLIKLADRLHNMRTLASLDEQRILDTARETRDIYAPLAHRMGIWKLKWELEDLAFKYLEPDVYREISEKIAQAREDRERYIQELVEVVSKRLTTAGIKGEVEGRPKHFASIYRKMREDNVPFEQIYDLIGVRIITTSKADCYRVLGLVHDLYSPMLERFKDYIATPKSNMYQSLHTTVFGPDGQHVEFQIRSREMHRTAELGIAAHYSYKEGVRVGGELQKVRELVRQATEWQEATTDPVEFMSLVKESLYHDEVFVFTPRGDLKHLPRGSTVLDFAYAVHTEVGDHCVSAKVNNRQVPLRHVLESGDRVEIVTSPTARPSDDWLKMAKSPAALGKIRHWLRQARLEGSVVLGREILEKELKRVRQKMPADLAAAAEQAGFHSEEQMLAAIGRGDSSAEHVVSKLFPRPRSVLQRALPIDRLRDLTERRRHCVRIEGISNLMVSFAHCCEPIPGDAIVGIITRGRGVSIHRADCPNAFKDRVEKGRRINVEWDVGKDTVFLVNLSVT